MVMRATPACALAIHLALATRGDAQPATCHYREFGDVTGMVNVVGPGQDGSLNASETAQFEANGTYPPYVRDQLDMYANLVYASPGLAEEHVLDYFKDASFGCPESDILRVYSPMAGLTIVRDASHGVPHVFGTTRYATMFGQGYATAEDRLFLMDVLRHVGRARMSEFLGASPGNVEMDREQLAVAPYEEADLTAQVNAFSSMGAEGQAILDDANAYIAGVNQYVTEATSDPTKLPAEYPALQQTPQPFKAEDIVAIASLVGGIFGKGGGGELANHCGLQAMTGELGNAGTARAIFDDLHFMNDPEAPTTSRTPTPYMTDLGPVDPRANPDVDCASLVPIDPTGPTLAKLLQTIARGGVGGLGIPSLTSNALLLSGEHTRTGAPIAVFGPQTGYFMPQLLVEKDVHGPGIDARGVAFAGTDIYVQLGRGRSFAWSATSAGADNIDQFVLKLCEPGGGAATTSSMGYLRNGICEPIEAYDHVQIAKPSAGGIPGIGESGGQCANASDDDGDGVVNDGCPTEGPLPELLVQCLNATDDDADGKVNDGCPPIPNPDVVLSFHVERTQHYGPLVARGTLTDGTPIAVATLRTTYRNELGSARGFRRVNDPGFMTNGYASFQQAMGDGVDYTFNWFYVDAAHIGYQHSCKCPQRAAGVDPYLPAWGDGRFDWQGWIPLASQPAALDPAEGFITSWNNKQAPGFSANDANFYYGPLFRSGMLDRGVTPLVASGLADRTDMIDAMERAATVDLRGEQVLPVVLDVLGASAPGGGDPRAQDMRDRLAAWSATDAHRRDFDHDGQYDDPQAPAIMDAWWPRLSHAVFDTTSGHAIDHLGLTLDDPNRRNHIGSAFQDGLYGHVEKDLRAVLGRPVTGPLSRVYCGGGDLAACRTALWASLSQAAADLQTEFGSAAVADWRRQIADEEIHHTAAGVTTVPAIAWQNRPTFQQVVQVPVGLCGAAPASGCLAPVVSKAAQLQIRNRTPDTLDRLVWKWTHGAATAASAFGDPRLDTTYDLCIYDADGLVSRTTVPPGGLCSGRSCWRQTATGFTYSTKTPGPRGLGKLILRSGLAGKAKILAKGKGGQLELPPLPISSLPLRVQLVNDAGACWTATFGTTLQNLGDRLRAKSD
jgi:acyl-homoserine lactone acylase PvdQ